MPASKHMFEAMDAAATRSRVAAPPEADPRFAALPRRVRASIEAAGYPVNPKVAELVFALNAAGIETLQSGDIFGDELVYVDLAPGAAAAAEAAALPGAWVLTFKNVGLTRRDALGERPPARPSGPAPRWRLARRGGAVSREEAAEVVAALLRAA
jgi:hypothetical protein